MKLKLFYIVTLLISSFEIFAQLNVPVNQRVIVNFEESVVYADVLMNDNKVKVNDGLYYFWFSSNDIKRTRGGYDGKLLHGNFTEFYLNKNLKEKGVFRYGLKNGEWKSWHINGELKAIIKWKKGKQHGEYKLFNEKGLLLEKGRFHYGLFNGKIYKYSNGCVTVEKYKKGTLKKEKQERILLLFKRKSCTKEVKPSTEAEEIKKKKRDNNKFSSEINSEKRENTKEKAKRKKK